MTDLTTPIPTKWVGPIRVSGNAVEGEHEVPLATYESPLWPSVGRGARISRMVEGGIVATVVDERMTRSVVVRAESAAAAHAATGRILARQAELEALVAGQSRFAKLIEVHPEIVGDLLFLRFAFTTGTRRGTTWSRRRPTRSCRRSSRGSRVCGTSASRQLLHRQEGHRGERHPRSRPEHRRRDRDPGRGRREAPALHPRADRRAQRRQEPHRLHHRRGPALRERALREHAPRVLPRDRPGRREHRRGLPGHHHGLGVRGDDLYFSTALPHLIVGTVGNGKGGDLPVVEDALVRLGCREDRAPGENARRLAALCAATVLCGELSLLAAQTNPENSWQRTSRWNDVARQQEVQHDRHRHPRHRDRDRTPRPRARRPGGAPRRRPREVPRRHRTGRVQRAGSRRGHRHHGRRGREGGHRPPRRRGHPDRAVRDRVRRRPVEGRRGVRARAARAAAVGPRRRAEAGVLRRHRCGPARPRDHRPVAAGARARHRGGRRPVRRRHRGGAHAGCRRGCAPHQRRPDLIEIEPAAGVFTADVDDFWRPNDRSTALVDGRLSVTAYVDAFVGAWDDLVAQGGPATRTSCAGSTTSPSRRWRSRRTGSSPSTSGSRSTSRSSPSGSRTTSRPATPTRRRSGSRSRPCSTSTTTSTGGGSRCSATGPAVSGNS